MTSMILLVSALVALVLAHRAHAVDLPSEAFVASFAQPMPRTNVRVLPVQTSTTWTKITPEDRLLRDLVEVPTYALPDEVEAALARLAHECERDLHTPLADVIYELEKMLTHMPAPVRDTSVREIPAPTDVELALCDMLGLDWNDPSLDDEIAPEYLPVIEHLPPTTVTIKSSAERMRAQRAALKAAGKTARGTTPQPPCNGTVDDPTHRHGVRSCKRKSVGVIEGWTKGGFCSYAHAAQYGLERVWAGEETMEQAKARMTKV